MFHKDSAKRDGYYTICKDCRAGKMDTPIVPDGYRKCKRCDEVKPINQFYPASDGYKRLTCIECCQQRWENPWGLKRQVPISRKQSLLGYLTPAERKALRGSNPKQRAKWRNADRKYRTSKNGRAKKDAWEQAHPLKRQCYDNTRKARKRNVPATFTAEEWELTLNAFNNACAYCGKTNVKLAQDHFMPLAKGGGYVLGNIVPACKHCNSVKKDRHPSVFCTPVQMLTIEKTLRGLL